MFSLDDTDVIEWPYWFTVSLTIGRAKFPCLISFTRSILSLPGEPTKGS